MLDLNTFEHTRRLERNVQDRQNHRRALWLEREPPRRSLHVTSGARRRLAQVLLWLADRLDPRAVVSAPHLPAAPSLNGSMHHA